MRLFVALEIPLALRQELERRATALRRDLPKASWVRPEAMHLTLSFLGETDPELLPRLHRELASACGAGAPLTLRLHEVGAFPPHGKARVLWTGLAAPGGEPCPALAALRSEVGRAVFRAASVEPDARPFHPHVTLARCRQPWPWEAVERFREGFGEPPGATFTVGKGTLFESELHPTGARYRVEGTYPLGGEA